MLTRKQHLLVLLSCGLLLAAGALRAEEPAVVADFDERPVPVKAVPPVYPPAMLRDHVAGLVNVMVVIDATGKVVERSVSKSTHPDFEKPALDAVGKWRFKPAAKGGSPVAVRVMIPISFKLET